MVSDRGGGAGRAAGDRQGREIWLQNGGEAFELVPAPNASAAWVKALVEIAGERLGRADRGL